MAQPLLEHVLFARLYPPVYDRNLDPSTWYANYIQTYIERDVRQIIKVHELRTFALFVKMCSARCGQLLNLSGLVSDCGVSVNTAKGWNTGAMDTLHFWRDHAGHKIDLIIEEGEKLHAAEIKSGKTNSSDFFDSLLKWKEIAGQTAASLRLIYGGMESQKRTGFHAVSWKDIDSAFAEKV